MAEPLKRKLTCAQFLQEMNRVLFLAPQCVRFNAKTFHSRVNSLAAWLNQQLVILGRQLNQEPSTCGEFGGNKQG